MNESNKTFYSHEAIKLFTKKPPLFIRFGYIFICLFVILLIVTGSWVYVPYSFTTNLQEQENASFIFEDKTKWTDHPSFEIITPGPRKIKITSYTRIRLDGKTYIRFSWPEDPRLLNGHDTYQIVFHISLLKSYLNYLFHGI